jgi:hypothetical protein
METSGFEIGHDAEVTQRAKTSGQTLSKLKQPVDCLDGAIGMAQCSFQLKGWSVTLAVALEVFLKGEAAPAYLFVPALPVVAFWLLDAWYLKRERLFRHRFDEVRKKNGPAVLSMAVDAFTLYANVAQSGLFTDHPGLLRPRAFCHCCPRLGFAALMIR